VELGVYIHFPFCGSRCGYCDFYSTVQPVPHEVYAGAVLRELTRRAPDFDVWPVGSIYFGGGTPSLWHPEQLGRVVRGVMQTLTPGPGLEVTVELNPTTRVDPELLLAAGVNRLSVGVQSMDDAVLHMLGRRHVARDAVWIVQRARAAGFANISCDVMLGLPGQSLEHHLCDVGRVLDQLQPDHVSTYGLTLAQASPLHRRGLRAVDADYMGQMMEQGRSLLRTAGFEQYEVSSYARGAGVRGRHNEAVWHGGPYLGLGARAHSMRLDPGAARHRRQVNPELGPYLDHVGDPWSEAVPGSGVEHVTRARSRFELLFLGLRTRQGLSRRSYQDRFGIDPVEEAGERLDPLVRRGMLQVTPTHLRPTAAGIWFADELSVRLAP